MVGGISRGKTVCKTVNGNIFVMKPSVKLSSREASSQMIGVLGRKPRFKCFACGKEGHLAQNYHTYKILLLRDPVQSGGQLTSSQAMTTAECVDERKGDLISTKG